jgi:hypothetical protein
MYEYVTALYVHSGVAAATTKALWLISSTRRGKCATGG